MTNPLSSHEKRKVELDQLKETLECFLYSASHDLKAPLRGVLQLVDWVMKDPGTNLSKESEKDLLLLKSRVHRMNTLLDALSEYAHAGVEYEAKKTFFLKEVLEEALGSLQGSDKFEVSFTEGENLEVLLEKKKFHLVLKHLLENAIKHHNEEKGKIVFKAYFKKELLIFEVIDDGPGIPLKKQEKIFGFLKTLHVEEEFEGVGLGLALVKKILEREGGSVSVQSEPSLGACFKVIWPLAKDEEGS